MIHDVRQHNSFHLCTYLLLHVRAGTVSLPSMVQVRLTELSVSPRSAREVEGAMDASLR